MIGPKLAAQNAMLVLAVSVGLVALGCSNPVQKPGATSQPHAQGTAAAKGLVVQERSYRSRYPQASRYAVVASTAKGGCGPELEPWVAWLTQKGYTVDPGLCRLAKDGLWASDQAADLVPSLSDALMQWHGRIEVEANYIGIQGEGATEDFFEQVQESLAKSLARATGDQERARLRVGLAVQHDAQARRHRLLLVQSQVRAQLSPFSRKVTQGQRVQIHGRLLQGRTNPQLIVVKPTGEILRSEPERAGQRFRAQVSCDRGPGIYQVELAAQGAQGPEIVLNVALACDQRPPDQLRYAFETIDPRVSYEDLELWSVQLLNELRARHGLTPLVVDPQLAKTARAHSRDMEALNFVGHRSPRHGDFAQRLERARLMPSLGLALENVASGVGPSDILSRLLASPGHRSNMLHPEVTHVGIGVAIRTTLGDPQRHELFLTQHFARARAQRPGSG